MITVIYPNFDLGIEAIQKKFLNTGRVINVNNWQSVSVKGTPKERMFEALHLFWQVQIPPADQWVEQIKPNVEWADEHFQERVSGMPLNPPPSHVRWPYAQKDNAEHGGNKQFSHTYPERIWPKMAGELGDRFHNNEALNEGIRYEYGDLNDMVSLLIKDKYTRQAFLPIWFPEDTGAVAGQRVPCTIGYHFIFRHGFLHITYWIRSCDYLRHFRDDVYLALKLADWVLDQLKDMDPENWRDVKLGIFTMHIVNLHIFEPEIPMLKPK